ncbi:hypothetical protein ABW19_dt0207719 [Dactylella cylindrospora]|nr:hypothetical protein ABW19_dt0207719 [Dactylella cylindrospora]
MAPPLIPNVLLQVRQQDTDERPGEAPSPQPSPSAPVQTNRPRPSNEPQTTTPTSTRSRDPRPSSTASSDPSRVTSTTSSTPTSENGPLNMTRAQSSIVITIVVLIGIVIFAFVSYIVLKSLRHRYKDPKYLPGSWLKKKWKNWDVIGYNSAATGSSSGPNQARINRAARSRANIEANRALDRQNSVRSVITLPPYREMAEMDLERTIGREGERDGVDTVIVFPETAEEEEDRREERMQAMYELRLQRRAQRAARDARASGSVASLENPNATTVSLTAMDMEAGGSGRTTSELTAAILNERSRRLSEVSYSDVGYSRSDGSRIRSTSSNRNETTDSQPLLSDAASAGRRSRSGSMLSLNTSLSGGRGSMDRRDSAEILTGAGADAGAGAGASTSVSGDLGQARLPPSYDGLDWGDAPPYMSPVSPLTRSNTAGSTAPRQPGLNLPLVRVTGASNPGSPMSPRDPSRREGAL